MLQIHTFTFTQAGAERVTPRTSVYRLWKLTTRSLLGEQDWLKKGNKRTLPSVALYVAFLAVSPVGDHRSMWYLDKFNREVRKKDTKLSCNDEKNKATQITPKSYYSPNKKPIWHWPLRIICGPTYSPQRDF